MEYFDPTQNYSPARCTEPRLIADSAYSKSRVEPVSPPLFKMVGDGHRIIYMLEFMVWR